LNALTLAMAAVSTGGFLPFDTGLDEVLGMFGLFIFAVFLLFGATSIFWQSMLFGGEVRRLGEHRESYSIIALIAVLTFVIFGLIASGTAGDDAYVARALVEGFLAAASLVATSGVESRPGIFALLPLVVVLFVVFAGASAFSTSGGIKHYRLGGMIVQSWGELDKLIYPNAVRSMRFVSEKRDIDLMKAIWSFFLAAILVIGIGTILVASSGIEFEAAFTATLVNFSTAGPVYDSGWAAPDAPDWPEYWQFSTLSKWVLMLVMLLGRLEVLVIVGLFSVRYWRNR
ncbi:MAG: potassium transporter TrkG, partial [Rhizobiaceae bacterium]